MKIRIGILGLGGVGGFIGAQLAEHYKNSDELDIVFIARPTTAKILRENGLKLSIAEKEKIVFPSVIASSPEQVGDLDILISCTKSYDLEESLKPLSESISEKTLILPLLNGVDATRRIQSIYPQAQVAEGCIYIVSRIMEPGFVKVAGDKHALHFGSSVVEKDKLENLQMMLKDSGINAMLSEQIDLIVWEKFLFISAIASMTSYLNQPMGKILEHQESKHMLMQLMHEFIEVALAHAIPFGADIFERTLTKMESLPYDTTSSMYNDFKKGGKTEYRSLTEFVVNLGTQLKIETPTYETILKDLKQRDRF